MSKWRNRFVAAETSSWDRGGRGNYCDTSAVVSGSTRWRSRAAEVKRGRDDLVTRLSITFVNELDARIRGLNVWINVANYHARRRGMYRSDLTGVSERENDGV